jgi:hypothetical protein
MGDEKALVAKTPGKSASADIPSPAYAPDLRPNDELSNSARLRVMEAATVVDVPAYDAPGPAASPESLPADVNIGFNPLDILHRLLVAIDQTEVQIASLKRHVDFNAVVTALTDLTAEQAQQIEAMYAEHEKPRTLRYDLFAGGDSGFPTDLTPDQIKRIDALLKGTRASSRTDAELAAAWRLDARAAELHGLLHGGRGESEVERVMVLLRSSVAENNQLGLAYQGLYNVALSAELGTLSPMDTVRASMLLAGQTPAADALKVSMERHRIEEIDKEIERLREAPFGNWGIPKLQKKRKQLVDSIEKRTRQSIEEGRREAMLQGEDAASAELAAQKRASAVLGDAAAVRAGLKPQEAAVVLATAGGDPAARAAAQLRRSSDAGELKASAIASALRGLRDEARAAAERALPEGTPEELGMKETELAAEYFDRLRTTYDDLGTQGETFDQLVQSKGNATEKELNDALVKARGKLDPVTEIELALRGGRKDLETVKRVLRDMGGPAIEKLKEEYEARTHRKLEHDLFGDAPTLAGGENPEMAGMFLKNQGKATGTDRLILEDYMQRPKREDGIEEVLYISARAEREYEYAIENRGVTGWWRDTWGNETRSLLDETIRIVRESSKEYLQLVGYLPDLGDSTITLRPELAQTERAHELVHRMRLARATIRGDREAYEKATAELRATLQFVASIVIQAALTSVLGPLVLAARAGQAVTAGARLLTWARTAGFGVATSISSNADLLGGFGGALGERLVGPVAQGLVRKLGPKAPAALAHGITAVGSIEGAAIMQGQAPTEAFTAENLRTMLMGGMVSHVATTATNRVAGGIRSASRGSSATGGEPLTSDPLTSRQPAPGAEPVTLVRPEVPMALEQPAPAGPERATPKRDTGAQPPHETTEPAIAPEAPAVEGPATVSREPPAFSVVQGGGETVPGRGKLRALDEEGKPIPRREDDAAQQIEQMVEEVEGFAPEMKMAAGDPATEGARIVMSGGGGGGGVPPRGSRSTRPSTRTRRTPSSRTPVTPQAVPRPRRPPVPQAGQVTPQNINRVTNMKGVLDRMEAANVTFDRLGFRSPDELIAFVNVDPDTAIRQLNRRLDDLAATATGPAVGKRPRVDVPHAVAGPERKWSREEVMGNTPGKDSPVGRQVQARMRQEGTLVGPPGREYVYHAGTDKWYPIAQCDMGHLHDAVTYWREEGLFYGARGQAVRDFQNNPDIYELQPQGPNRSAGASLGEEYVAPHPDPITPEELAGQIKPRPELDEE